MQSNATTSPTLVLIDVQKEYVTPGRPFFLSDIGPSLQNCRLLLASARRNGLRILHIQHLGDGPVFNRNAPESGFVDGFEPQGAEFHLTKAKLPCYSNPQFATLLDHKASGPIFVAGYGSTMCCLATIAAAPLFGHRLTFIHDASWARAAGGLSEAEQHRNAAALLAAHGGLSTTGEALSAFDAAIAWPIAAE